MGSSWTRPLAKLGLVTVCLHLLNTSYVRVPSVTVRGVERRAEVRGGTWREAKPWRT